MKYEIKYKFNPTKGYARGGVMQQNGTRLVIASTETEAKKTFDQKHSEVRIAGELIGSRVIISIEKEIQ